MKTLGGWTVRAGSMAACVLAALAGTAAADTGGVLDRIPTNAALVIVVPNMESASAKIDRASALMGGALAGGEDNPIAKMKQILGTPGLNKTGTMAMAMLPNADGEVDFETEMPEGVILVPVSDFGAFVKQFNGEAGQGVTTVTIDGNEGFIKDIGGGYAVLAPTKGQAEAFDGKAGNRAAHEKALGPVGRNIAQSSDVIIITNVNMLRDQFEDGLDSMGDAAAGAVPVPGADIGLDVLEMAMRNWAQQADSAIVGMGLDDKGLSIQVGTQFKEGSEVGGFFTGEADSSSLLGRLPKQQFLFAMAMDSAPAPFKKLIANMKAEGKKAAAAATPAEGAEQANEPGPMAMFDTVFGMSDKVDGMALGIGASPAGFMGGLFTLTSAYMRTNDPKALLEEARAATKKLDGYKTEGMTYKVKYDNELLEINGTKVDSWSGNIDMDPNDPEAMNTQMMMGIIFGQGGLGGMNATVDKGVVMTMSPNTPLVTSALEAAKNGGGLSTEEGIASVQSKLPAKRFFELYIGSKALLDNVTAGMAMAGMGGDIEVPAKLAPVAIAASNEKSGVGIHIYVPIDVIKSAGTLAEELGGMMGDFQDMAPAEGGDAGEQPAF